MQLWDRCLGDVNVDSRERTFLALEHCVGDRIPVDFWATGSTIRRLEQGLGIPYTAFLDRHDVDLRYIAGPAYSGPPLEDGTDIWGVRRHAVSAGAEGHTETYSEVIEAPLGWAASPKDVQAYTHWPSPDWFDYTDIEAQCDELLRQRRVVVFMGDRLNRMAQLKPAMYLRGTEKIFMDLTLHPDVAQTIFREIKRFYLGYMERILEAANGKIDIVVTGDDFGAQNGLLLSPDMWRNFLAPGFSEYLRFTRGHGVKTMHHTCGSVVDIIPDMAACGLDILQSIQPEAEGMSLTELKSAFGGQLCFHGGVSIQQTMPYGSREQIRREVESIADVVGQDGGYIFCTSHNIQADTSVANITALLEAYSDYGKI